MESSEDDAGAIQDSARQPPTRENSCEKLSGEVSDENYTEVQNVNTSSGSSVVMEAEPVRSSSATLSHLDDRLSPPLDGETCHNTETILNMIDDIIDGPKPAKRTKYLADSTDSNDTQLVRSETKTALDLVAPVGAWSSLNKLSKSDYVASVSSGGDNKSATDCLEEGNMSKQNINLITGDSDRTSFHKELSQPLDIQANSTKSENMVNVISSSDKTAALVPVQNNNVRNSEESSDLTSSGTVIPELVNCEGTLPDSVKWKTASPISFQQNEVIPLDSYSVRSEQNADCSPSKTFPGQRRKLVRPTSNTLKVTETTKALTTSVNCVSLPEKANVPLLEPGAAQSVNISKGILASNATDLLSINTKPTDEEQEKLVLNVSPKKVKLVRNSILRSQAQISQLPLSKQPVVTESVPPLSERATYPLVAEQPVVFPSQFDETNEATNFTLLQQRLSSPVDRSIATCKPDESKKNIVSTLVEEKCLQVIMSEEVIPEKSPIEICEVIKPAEELSNKAKEFDCVSPPVVEQNSIMSIFVTNNMEELREDHNITPDRSNDVLDVRKVSRLKLNRSILEDSHVPNAKSNAIIHNVKDIPNDLNSEELIETIPKLTLKLGPKPTNQDLKLSSKTPKVNIKPIKPPESKVQVNQKNFRFIKANESSDVDMESHKIPNVVKLTIKPILKPQGEEDRTQCQDEKSSSWSQVSESDSSENEITSKCVQSPTVETTELELTEKACPPVPKITIKSLSTVPKVNVDSPRQKPAKRPAPCDSIPKVTIKPLIPPPIEKMTIKLNKSHDTNTENKCEIEPPSHSETIPKMTIKIGKSPECSSEYDENNCQEENPLKLTIKLNKVHENSSESKIDTLSDASNIPKSSKRTIQKIEALSEPHVPKLTIRLPQENELRLTERSDSPAVPRLTIKPIMKPDDHVSVPKVSIKPIPKPSEESTLMHSVENEPENTTSLKMVLKSRSKPDEVSLPRLNIKPVVRPDADTPTLNDWYENATSRSSKSQERTISELDIHNPLKLTIKPITENIDRPLEIITSSPSKSSPSFQESGLDSPRIILKINKTTQGATSEILTEKCHKKTDSEHSRSETDSPSNLEQVIPKLTIKLAQEQNVDSKEENCREPVENERNLNSPLGRIKLKFTKEGSQTKVVNQDIEDSDEPSKENVSLMWRTGLKRPPTPEDSLINNCPDVDKTIESKRVKLDQLLSNSNITVTKVSKNKSQTDPAGKMDLRSNACISVLALGSNEENITSEFNKVNSLPKTSHLLVANNGESKLQGILTKLKAKHEEKLTSSVEHFPFSKAKCILAVVEADSNTTSTASSDVSDANRLTTDSPIFNKVDGDLMTLNEGSNSQECMIVDDLSQDPLDIGSIAKTHFVPVTNANSAVTNLKNSIVNIIAQSQVISGIPMASQFTPTPKKRGRPRKIPLLDGVITKSPKIPTPALEERPVRATRTPRYLTAYILFSCTYYGRQSLYLNNYLFSGIAP